MRTHHRQCSGSGSKSAESQARQVLGACGRCIDRLLGRARRIRRVAARATTAGAAAGAGRSAAASTSSLVDVVVRDQTARSSGLTADDFELLEDGVRSRLSRSRSRRSRRAAAPVADARRCRRTAPSRPPQRRRSTARAPTAHAEPLTSEDVAGHRLLDAALRHELDAAGGRPEGRRRRDQVGGRADDAGRSGGGRVDRLQLEILTDFTSSKEKVRSALDRVLGGGRHRVRRRRCQHGGDRRSGRHGDRRHGGRRRERAGAGHLQQRRAAARAEDAGRGARRRFSRRKRSSTSAPACSGAAPTTRSSCARRSTPRCAPTSPIYPVDCARPAGGRAGRQRPPGQPRRGERVLRPRVASQFPSSPRSRRRCTTLASDTGGTAFTDTNDFGEAFTQVVEGHLVVLHPRVREHEPRARTAGSARSPCV